MEPEPSDSAEVTGSLYAPPRSVAGVADCRFYHSMDIPGYGTVTGPWDLRGREDAYLGGIDVSGKRVLDVGTASGALAFHLERAGADVVAYDLSEDDPWDRVPWAGDDADDRREQERLHIGELNNGFWLSHGALGSQVRMVHGTVYDVPAALGAVDMAVFGAILLHLRDPVRALESVLGHVRETVVIVEPVWRRRIPSLVLGRRSPVMRFLPRGDAPEQSRHGWWWLSPAFLREAVGVLGFHTDRISYHRQLQSGRRELMYTLVGHRIRG